MHTHESDDVLFGMLKQLQIDFQRPREVNFYFVFKNQSNADGASRLLQQKNWTIDRFTIDPPWWKRLFAKPTWWISVTREMQLDEKGVKAITTEFQKIAESFDGEYDGWEANVVDDQIDQDKLTRLQGS
ncbi:MAG: ribonuclease E inhibitor RraB [Pirellula sp.]|jgi:hypothetical protein|nr:ribonuclease E inhibitor RraB [Pirellula sp.]